MHMCIDRLKIFIGQICRVLAELTVLPMTLTCILAAWLMQVFADGASDTSSRTHLNCCASCTDFCSPASGNCYEKKGKDYYLECSTRSGDEACPSGYGKPAGRPSTGFARCMVGAQGA